MRSAGDTSSHAATSATRGSGSRTADGRAVAACAVAAAYALLRGFWQVSGPPDDMSPLGHDLVVFTGWDAVALCSAAAALAVALARGGARGRARSALLATSWCVSLSLGAASAMVLLDVVAAVFPGMGLDLFPLGALSRVACLTTALLLASATRSYQRRTGEGCETCGRAWTCTRALIETPRWAYVAAYVSMTGCLVRIVAQAVVGFDQSPTAVGRSAVAFEVCFVLGGTLLPLALVHGWGRLWPRWIPGLGGRNVPRWLVLGPGVGVSGAIVVYFGIVLVQMISERLQGRNPFPPDARLDLPEAFFWVAVPAYLVWGVGLAFAALAYARRTRQPCASCGL